MRHLLLAALLLAATPVFAQPRLQAFDGAWEGTRYLSCRSGGRISRERVTLHISGGVVTIPAMLGDPEMTGTVNAEGVVQLPRFNTFGEGSGQITGDAFNGQQPNRTGNCSMIYELQRQAPPPRRR